MTTAHLSLDSASSSRPAAGEQIHQVIAQSGLAVAIDQSLACRQRLGYQSNGLRMVTARATGQTRAIQSRNAHDRVIECLGAFQAQRELADSLAGVSLGAGQDAPGHCEAWARPR
jgi:hypothetical protein